MASHRQHELLPMGERSDAVPPTAAGGLDYEEEEDGEEAFDLELEAERLGEARRGEGDGEGEEDGSRGVLNPDQLREQESDPAVVFYADRRFGGDGEPPCWTRRMSIVSAVLLVVVVIVALIAHFAAQLHNGAGGGSGSGSGSGGDTRSYVRISASGHDGRAYRFVQLVSNSLGVLLVSDPNCTAASGAMSVGTGSGADPPHRQGLAHFLEHALFLGSTQHPDQHAYAAFLAAHGGSANAYTSEEETSVHTRFRASTGRRPQSDARYKRCLTLSCLILSACLLFSGISSSKSNPSLATWLEFFLCFLVSSHLRCCCLRRCCRS